MATGITKERKKRVTLKTKKSPNPLFERWLEEWKNEAASKGSDMQYCFGKALKSLRKYPLPLKSGRECGILDCFGNRLCIMLDRKLAEYRKENPEGQDSSIENTAASCGDSPRPRNRKVARAVDISSPKDSGKRGRRVGKGKQYLPAWRSGPYAILLALLEETQGHNSSEFLTKAQLQAAAQPWCDVSFTRPDPGSHYTAWSSMAGLVKRGLVLRQGCPARFSLSEAGRSMARQLRDVEGGSQSPALETGVEQQSRTAAPPEPEADTVILQPNSFDIILLVDKKETSGGSGLQQLSKDATVADLSALGALFELRHLKVGDFAWVCRDRATGQELVLPYIVERKRMDDLAKSIRDGRFHEQKFRLKQSGVQHLLYLVESHGDDQHTTLPLQTLNQAAINTQVVDGFTVKTTQNHRGSMRFLATMTRLLHAAYHGKILVSCRCEGLPPTHIRDDLVSLMTFCEFNSAATKTKIVSRRH
ncbi:crossover junction endonuclease MUS81 isoform X2 [Periplaneta americana]|uniref:crossover junction endonuclease MUS81 isoform X2 n=1 Tax=Periplaneta americana TaxID=6978 RepID=UPI0037E87875